MEKVIAIHIADSIDVRKFWKSFGVSERYHSSSEIFYANEKEQYLYLLTYGVVVFCGYNEAEIANITGQLKPYCKNLLSDVMREELPVHTSTNKDAFEYNEIHISKSGPNVIRIIMLNVAQSVALDYYAKLGEELMTETNQYIQQLETRGKINISFRKLKMFIGKVLNIKNRIAYNLYIFDSPEETWEDEYLNRIDSGLRRTFDIRIRFRDIDNLLQIIRDNLNLLNDLAQHRYSNILEWVVILLILAEVIDLIIARFILHY